MGLPVINLVSPQSLENLPSLVVHFDAIYTDPDKNVVATSILFEIDQVSTFNSPQLIQVTYSNVAHNTTVRVIESLQEGTWSWRVTAINPDGTTVSQVRALTISTIIKRALSLYVNVAKALIPWGNKRILAQYANVSKQVVAWGNKRTWIQYASITKTPVAWSNQRAWSQYSNITSDPPFPFIERLSTRRGPQGAHVTIYGSGFGFTNLNDSQNANRFLRGYGGLVYLGTTSCGIISWSWNKIVIQVPIGAQSGAIKVQLTVPSSRDSNLKGFEVYEGIPTDDVGIELFLCDRTSPNLIVRQLDLAKNKAFQLLQNNPGSGSFQISRYDAGATGLTEDNLILVKLDGQPLFKWIIESVKPSYVSSDEHQLIAVSGRGVLSLLNRAVVYPENLGEPQLDRLFTGTASTVLRTLILEAQHRGSLLGIDIGWENDRDSIGNVFVEDVNLSFHVGTPLSEVVSKFTEGLGFFDIDMTPNLKLNIYKDRSVDLHETVIYRPGQAILSHQHQIDTSKLVNEILVEGKEKQLAISTHPESAYTFGRREGYLSANNIRSGLSEYGDAYLKRIALPQWGIQGTVVKFTDENGYKLKPLETFGIGDWIGWNIPPDGHDPVGFSDKVKVRGITVSENEETGALEYTLDLNNTMLEHEIKMNQKVERFTQFSGSDVLSTPSSSSDGYSESEVNQLLQNKANKVHEHEYALPEHTHNFTELTDAPGSLAGNGRKVVVVNAEETALKFQTNIRSFAFFIGGILSVKSGVGSILCPMPLEIIAILLSVDNAPMGSSLICDLNLNGTSIYPTNKPTIAAGSLTATVALPAVVILPYGSKISLDIDQVGSSFAGASLSMTIVCEVT